MSEGFPWTWVKVASLSLFLYFLINLRLLADPAELGDFLSGAAAIISLPAIFIVFYQQKQQEEEQSRESKKQFSSSKTHTIMKIYEHLNHEFNHDALDLRYQIENKFGLKPRYNNFDEKQNMLSYLYVNYFSSDRYEGTLEIIKSKRLNTFVFKRFCDRVQELYQSLHEYNELVDEKNQIKMVSLENHAAYKIYVRLNTLFSGK